MARRQQFESPQKLSGILQSLGSMGFSYDQKSVSSGNGSPQEHGTSVLTILSHERKVQRAVILLSATK